MIESKPFLYAGILYCVLSLGKGCKTISQNDLKNEDKSQCTKIGPGGIFLSEDGGDTWNSIFENKRYVYDITSEAVVSEENQSEIIAYYKY
jgi:hypothetical protein